MPIRSFRLVSILAAEKTTASNNAGASNQAGLIRALNCNMTDNEYHEILRYARERCGRNGIDKVLEENDVDIIMGPGDGAMFTIAATAGKSSLEMKH